MNPKPNTITALVTHCHLPHSWDAPYVGQTGEIVGIRKTIWSYEIHPQKMKLIIEDIDIAAVKNGVHSTSGITISDEVAKGIIESNHELASTLFSTKTQLDSNGHMACTRALAKYVMVAAPRPTFNRKWEWPDHTHAQTYEQEFFDAFFSAARKTSGVFIPENWRQNWTE